MQTFYWHDYETWGADPQRTRASQFAGIRTDLELNEIGEPLMIYCQPVIDVLPEPEACLITRITPQHAQAYGLKEPEFIRQIHAELSQPGTCGIGYNSLRFDDEVTRHTLWRNFYDPYEREWRYGNSRFDLIDVVRMCSALRPEGMQWPTREDGSPSFKLEHLTAVNGIVHEGAHDALVDVRATIALAKKVRLAQPKLFEYALTMRDKRKVAALLNVIDPKPLLHFSEKFPNARHCGAVIMPLAMHPTMASSVICYDLNEDPTPLITLGVEEIQARLFTPRASLPEGVERIALKAVRTNRSPMLAPVSLLDDASASRMHIDQARCRLHYDQLRQAGLDLVEKLQQVFAPSDRVQLHDVEQTLYAGNFLSAEDKALSQRVRRTSPDRLAVEAFAFNDPRLDELLFRYRARNYPDTLNEAERNAWREYLRKKLVDGQLGTVAFHEIKQRIAALFVEHQQEASQAILRSLDDYIDGLYQQVMAESKA